MECYQTKNRAIIFFHSFLALSPVTGIKILWLERGCQAETAFMFKARRILKLHRPDADDRKTGSCFSLHIWIPTPHSRGKPHPPRTGSFFIHSTTESRCQGFLIRPQNRFCQDLPMCGAGTQVSSPAPCTQLGGASPALLLRMVNLRRIEP